MLHPREKERHKALSHFQALQKEHAAAVEAGQDFARHDDLAEAGRTVAAGFDHIPNTAPCFRCGEDVDLDAEPGENGAAPSVQHVASSVSRADRHSVTWKYAPRELALCTGCTAHFEEYTADQGGSR